MTRLSTTTALKALLAVGGALIIAGCGSRTSSSGSEDNRPGGGAGLNGLSLGNCLIDENWIVQPSETTLDGTSDTGVPFTINIYKSVDAAKQAAGTSKSKEQLGVAVVTYKGTPTPYKGGGEAGKTSSQESATIEKCIKQAQGS